MCKLSSDFLSKMYEEDVEYTNKLIHSFSFYCSLVKLREVIEYTLNLNFGENFALVNMCTLYLQFRFSVNFCRDIHFQNFRKL